MNTRTSSILSIAISLAAAAPADASLIVNMVQSGADVVATASGTLNLAALTKGSATAAFAVMRPSTALLFLGPSASLDIYTGTISHPGNFGTNTNYEIGSSGSGDAFGFAGDLAIPQTYVSGNLLTSSATWSSKSFASLGVTPGTYAWTWGSGGTADSITLNIGQAPEPISLALFAAGLAALGFARRRT